MSWPKRFPIVQFPNAPLWLALAGALVARLVNGDVHAYARGVFYVGLSAWAWLELTDGDNWFRRLLGLVGLAYVTLKVGDSLR
jgi:hypothetical protein